jgi:FlaG/FlaF family flagellin (archaellin)
VLGDDRAATETLGTVLLVGVVGAAVSLLAGSVLFVQSADDGPLADVTTNVTVSQVVLNHTGGDPLDADRVSVVIRGENESRKDGLDDVGERLEPGEGTVVDHDPDLDPDPGDRVRVLVVHDNTTVLYDAERTVYPD